MQREIVADRESGLFATTPQEWTDRVIELVRDAGLRAALAAEGRRVVERHFGLARWAPSWLAAIAGSRRARGGRR
jgi:hypothetical protein